MCIIALLGTYIYIPGNDGMGEGSFCSVHDTGSLTQVVHLMRHGITEMNVHLTKNPYGGKGFKDPLMCVGAKLRIHSSQLSWTFPTQ